VEAAEARLRQLQAGATAEERAIAASAVDQARRNLADLKTMRDDPLLANAEVDSTRGQFDAASAAVEAARARLDAARAGPTAEQLDVARAQVKQAESAVATVRAQVDRATLTAPIAGTIARRSGRIGEVVIPGSIVATVISPRPLKLTFYVTETRIGGVSLGQQADVTVDGFPGVVFLGEVVYVSQRAEFTPRNVQTQRDRATTVFAVRLRLPNDDGRLKPGMPADAKLR
jgi:multidrug resistance efflux pump